LKVTYPISLKVSVWLLLNLLLLAAAAVGFFVVRGGLGWSALLAGPAGEHAQSTANVVAGEAAAATRDNRDAVLKRFGTAHRAEFFLVRGDDPAVIAQLPAEVRARLEFRGGRPGPGPEFGGRFGGRRGGFGPGERPDPRRREGPEPGPEPMRREGDEGKAPPPPEGMRREFGGPGPERTPFVVRTTAPAAYWVGLRVPFVSPERGRPVPAILVTRLGSLWSLLRFLNLQSWLLAASGVLMLSILFWWPLMRGITRSLGQLTSATEQIASGRFDTRVPAARRDEIGQLGDSVNRMAARLDAHMTGQKKFLGDVAHELCSPLARLQLASGILADRAPVELRETVTDLREEVQQMSTLVNELLLFTKAGMQPRKIALQAVDIAAAMQHVIAREAPAGAISVAADAGLRAMADPDALARALANLLRNAVRYAGASGHIFLSARHEAAGVIIVVEDDGPGVPAESLDRLGEPFFRPEAARTREHGGVGLGLSIVRSSIAASGGDVRFSNREPHGFRAEIRLPAA
jgi:two-component system sensor histidine kinase CpxA